LGSSFQFVIQVRMEATRSGTERWALRLIHLAAARYGGIVAPSQGYHIHESRPHAPWLEEVVGDVNPRLAALPPDPLG
jgi:hypothetical protein